MNAAAASPRKYRVMIVDDHPIMRTGIAAVLGRDPSFVVCCEAGSEQEVKALLPNCALDLAIIDLSLINFSGVMLFRHLLKHQPQLRILVLSMHDETVYAQKVLQAGAHGYVMKGEAGSTLMRVGRESCENLGKIT